MKARGIDRRPRRNVGQLAPIGRRPNRTPALALWIRSASWRCGAGSGTWSSGHVKRSPSVELCASTEPPLGWRF